MQGYVLDFSIQDNMGYISGKDGKRYTFTGREWKEEAFPKKGDVIDFDVDAFRNGNAIQVFFALANSNVVNSNLSDLLVKEQHYVDFSGRARRKEYWYFFLCGVIFAFLIGFIFAIIADIANISDESSKQIENIIIGIIYIGIILPSLSVFVRRLHDVGRSGWWYLLSFTVIGWLPLMVGFVQIQILNQINGGCLLSNSWINVRNAI